MVQRDLAQDGLQQPAAERCTGIHHGVRCIDFRGDRCGGGDIGQRADNAESRDVEVELNRTWDGIWQWSY
ncbi:hypothetical protein D3C78_1874880 [compost metagenome]